MPISVALYIPNFASGGAERLNINLAEAWQRYFDVCFVVHKKEGALLSSVPPNVRIVSLEASRTLGAWWPLVKFLRRERPNILLSSLGNNNINALWAGFFACTGTRMIVSHHNSLRHERSMKQWQLKVVPFLYRLFLAFADGIVAVSEGVADELAAIAGIARDRIRVIYNPVITEDFEKRLGEPATHPWLTDGGPPVVLGVGRLVEQKDFSTLLDAFALVVKQRAARLIILGEGPLRQRLLDQVQRLGIADKVDMAGFVSNPLPFMLHAGVFVLSSRFEGFGNVLVEALACGTPVVSTACRCGPEEILDDGRFGRLVPVGDVDAMARAICETLAEEPKRNELLTRGRSFTVRLAAALYEDLFYKLHYGREPFNPAGLVDY